MSDFCPITGGDHKYFVHKTFDVYVPLSPALASELQIRPAVAEQLYMKMEKAIINCQCGDVKKTTVKEDI